MRHILIIGAGRSAASLIKYLIDHSESEDLFITVGDISESSAQKYLKGTDRAKGIVFDVFNQNQREELIKQNDLVISMLPAHLHIAVAKDCLAFGKHMVTASYISKELEALNDQVTAKGLVFMNEIGLDPGIDHMSAMQVIDQIRREGGEMLLFESFTGGLIAPESDTNLWRYKFTWNPRNVVLAGQGGAAEFIQEGSYKYIPYHRLFRRTEFLDIDGHGRFEAYANRNSLKYRSIYGLNDILTLYRGTIRHVGYSKAWNMFVQLGMTDDSYTIPHSEDLTYRQFVNLFLPYSPTDSVELKLRLNLKIDQDDLMWDKLEELDLFNEQKTIGIQNATPAQGLQKILMDKWTLEPEDKDMIVMYHKFGYAIDGVKKQIDSHMVLVGQDQTATAMAKTVGLPVAIAALKILNGTISTPGVQLPIRAEVYEPILKELEDYGVIFREKKVPYMGYNPSNMLG
ncbi:MAG: saccharopine dehydrogenase NADP-binding domain-containing protein [Flavobacteriaceae bacterium]|nr:saccharopine dehydrogenase NADP-binding domain-containing protein [Flavobacteriaceae bacterium]MDG1962853.1 saccharopine dehydrogenase NADP-binding domain-containing protein [Flavobacteriaceae bacterium]